MATFSRVQAPTKPPRRWLRITARVLLVVFVLWAVFVGYMWRIMHRTPDGFARVMMHMCQHNPRIITTTPVRMWVTRRDNLRSLAHLIARKEEIVVVR